MIDPQTWLFDNGFSLDFIESIKATSTPLDLLTDTLKQHLDEGMTAAEIEAHHFGTDTKQNLTESVLNFLDEKGKISAPELANYTRRNLPYIRVIPENDTGRETNLLYDSTFGVYRSVTSKVMQGKIRDYAEASGRPYPDSVIKSSWWQISLDAPDSPNEGAKKVMREMPRADANYINFRNGLLDLRTLQLKPHTPSVITLHQLPAEWEHPNALPETPVFDSFIDYLTAGDKTAQKTLYEFIGLTLSNEYAMQRTKRVLFLVGAGNTGKSKFFELLTYLVGGDSNVKITTLENFESRFGLAGMDSVRLIGSPDDSSGFIGKLAHFKTVSGADPISIERKGVDEAGSRFYGTMLYCCNHLPSFGGDLGSWVYDRLLPISCNPVSVPEEKRDKDLLDKLKAEANGIVVKSVCAFLELKRRNWNFIITDKQRDLLTDYAITNDPVTRFISECTEEESPDTASYSATEFYNSFVAWWRRQPNSGHGETMPTVAKFNEQLLDYLIHSHGLPSSETLTKHTKKGNFVRVLTLNDYGYNFIKS